MAIMKKKKKQSGPSTVKWDPRPNDAIKLAALRWFALEMERIAIQLYASNPDLYGEMETIMRQTLKSLGDAGRQIADPVSGECPEGYVLCPDGICAPMCDPFIAFD